MCFIPMHKINASCILLLFYQYTGGVFICNIKVYKSSMVTFQNYFGSIKVHSLNLRYINVIWIFHFCQSLSFLYILRQNFSGLSNIFATRDTLHH